MDKKNGCRLICEAELQQIRDDIDSRYTKDETYPKEKLYTQDEVNDLLANKVNITADLQWHQVELLNGYHASVAPQYSKDENGWVTVAGSIQRDTKPEPNDLIFQLPEGFRPQIPVPFVLKQGGNTPWSTYAWIGTHGDVAIPLGGGGTPDGFNGNNAICLSAVFKAQ